MRHKTLIMLLLWLAILPLLVEFGLRLLDPWGVVRYFSDLSTLYQHFREDDLRGYVLPAGHYVLSNWQVTIEPDTSRSVPDSKPGCTVVFLGDSVTFGHGVNDAETWVNDIARQVPIHAVNMAVDGYNIDNVLGTLNTVRGDAYVYLLIDNDADGPLDWQHATYTGQRVILDYWYVIQQSRPQVQPPVRASFYTALQMLIADPRVTIVAFDTGGLSSALASRYPIHLIPLWHHANSRADGHANAEGNREIAVAMLPIVKEAVQKNCTTYI